jgi:hypothetical protein
MKTADKIISRGFIAAGIANLSVLIWSRFFTNSFIPEFDPVVMSNFGLLMILIWGLAYISVAKSYFKVKWLIIVFVVEKLIYGCAWIYWMLNHSLETVYDHDLFAGVFYSIYGINDLTFCGFFIYVSLKIFREKKSIE